MDKRFSLIHVPLVCIIILLFFLCLFSFSFLFQVTKTSSERCVWGWLAVHLFLQDAAHQGIILQVGADKEVGTGGKSVDIGDKLEDEGLEGVQLFDEPQKKVKQKLADGQYINFCSHLKEKYKL